MIYMGPKKNMEESVMIRLEKSVKQSLAKEAEADGRTVAAYIRHLIDTHPKRIKK